MLTCIVDRTPDRTWSGIDLRPARVTALEDDFFFVHGSLGWHITWGILFDLKTDPPTAYETRDGQINASRAFGRVDVPAVLRRGVIKCGIEWSGLWPDQWPRERGMETSPEPPDQLDVPSSERPITDPLPPLTNP